MIGIFHLMESFHQLQKKKNPQKKNLQISVFPHPCHFILILLHSCLEGICFKCTKQNGTQEVEGWRIEKNGPPEEKPAEQPKAEDG